MISCPKRISELEGRKGHVRALAWSPGGVKLASGGAADEILVHDVEHGGGTAAKASGLRGHEGQVEQLRFDPARQGGDRVLSVSVDKTAKVWDVRSGKCASTIDIKESGYVACWSPSGKHLAVGTTDTVFVVDAATMAVVWEQKFKFEVNAMTWDVSGKIFMMATGEGKMEKFSFDETSGALTPHSTHFAHNGGCYCIDMDPTGKFFAMGAADAIVSLWESSTDICYDTVVRLDHPIRTLSFSHDSAYIASGSEDLFVDIADVKTGECMAQIKTEVPTNAVAFHPKEMVLAFAGEDKNGTVRLWSAVHTFSMGSK